MREYQDDPSAVGRDVAAPWAGRFGEYLEASRRRAMLSRAQLAIRLGVTEESVRRWERGGARPSANSLARLIAVLAIDGAELAPPSPPDELPGLARMLRAERSARGLIQAQVAQVLGVAQPTYAGWEIGRATPAPAFLPSVAVFLGEPLEAVNRLVAAPFTVDTSRWPPLGQVLGSWRQALRMTREELARLVGVAPGTVVAWELGYRTPRPRQIPSLAVALEVSVAQLEAAVPRREPQLTALGQLIRASQLRLGLGRSDLAARAGLDEATISRWIHGRHVPELASLRRLAAALELPFDRVCREAGLTS